MPAFEKLKLSQGGWLYIFKMGNIGVILVSKAGNTTVVPLTYVSTLMGVNDQRSNVFQCLCPQINLGIARNAHFCPRPRLGYWRNSGWQSQGSALLVLTAPRGLCAVRGKLLALHGHWQALHVVPTKMQLGCSSKCWEYFYIVLHQCRRKTPICSSSYWPSITCQALLHLGTEGTVVKKTEFLFSWNLCFQWKRKIINKQRHNLIKANSRLSFLILYWGSSSDITYEYYIIVQESLCKPTKSILDNSW